ncbi:DNA replication and repair protein RecR [Allochromatium warmingii]|uniref:Recombination protein RecR n=1 Tax=Allochromatium warmingii TaxID=61595 RepID=A0A1H3GI41_ALLWA|nr:recombination mediator RecR [Allochromatium warmingii]SDY03032.1 DNA replication and repair protein RecR [Allochromatium warmingii]
MGERSLLNQLIDALRCLPGVGPKSARRIAFYLLERDRDGGAQLARVMAEAMVAIRRCTRCRTLTEHDLCALCANPQRDAALLCIVEQPSEVVALEQATDYRGQYFVLGGRLSPLDGIGPDELGLNMLETRLRDEAITEIILAISPTVEGRATAQLITERAARYGIRVTRIAQGVPLGGELEYLDSGTLALAFAGRRDVV